MMIYLLGMGSSSHPLPPAAWSAWKRTTFEYDGLRYIGSFAPLFVHQYSQAWFDFRGKRDKYADYFQNSVIATDVHRRFCLGLSKIFLTTATICGASPPPTLKTDTWSGAARRPWAQSTAPWFPAQPQEARCPFFRTPPCASSGTCKDHYPQAWSRYGFVDAFNPLKNWYDTDVVGIDTGITMLMAENVRTSFVWDTFMKSEEAQRGMERAGFEADEK